MNRQTLAPLNAAGLLAALTIAASPSLGQTYHVDQPAPNLDRWNYPFGDFSGDRWSAPTFTTNGVSGFDDRDAEFLIGFGTSAQIPTGRPLTDYNITSLVLSVVVNVPEPSQAFIYDATHDALATYFQPTDSGYVPDPDDGRPIELFACGYRPTSSAPNAPLWTPLTYHENSPFNSVSANPPPARNNRNVFPVSFNAAGVPINCANNVTQTAADPGSGVPFEVNPLAVGQTTAVAPGQPVPEGAVFTFAVDVNAPGVQNYLRQALNLGQLNLMVSSLHPSQQPGGQPVPVNYPTFYTKENPLGIPARLVMNVTIGVVNTCLADICGIGGPPSTPDGLVTGDDFIAFINAFAAGDTLADVCGIGGPPSTPDGLITGDDFIAFINAFAAGCP